MQKALKQAIVKFIFDNENEFQLNNATTEFFREYIYSGGGQYLIGGREVSDFIEQAINLLKK